MRRLAVLFALMAAPAGAQDVDGLGACVERVGAAQAVTGERLFDPRACVGSVEFLCEEMGEGDCVEAERAAWAGLAGAALEELQGAAVDDATAQALRDGQADWEGWVAGDCALVAPFTDDPGVAEVAGAYCLRDAWAERAIVLRARAAGIF